MFSSVVRGVFTAAGAQKLGVVGAGLGGGQGGEMVSIS